VLLKSEMFRIAKKYRSWLCSFGDAARRRYLLGGFSEGFWESLL
jgi:hypothetical protein